MNAITTRKPAVSTDIFGSTLTLNFSNGKELEVDVTKLSAEIIQHATLHGLKQKLVDAAAIARNTETGQEATIEDKYAAVKTVFDRITSANGTWNAVREGEAKVAGGIFLRAMMEMTSKPKDEMQTALEALSKEQIAALKKNPRVVDIMQRMEREALKDDKTGDDLLALLAGDVVKPTETPLEKATKRVIRK